MKKRIAILILAAGASSRMGAVKQLLPWKSTTLLGNAIELAKTTMVTNVFVVVGANVKKVTLEVLRNKAVIIINKEWEQGIGTSIATGVKSIIEIGGFDGVLLMLADQPFLTSHHLLNIIDRFGDTDKLIIASSYTNIQKPVVPILFDAIYFGELSCLDSEEGAKNIIKKHKEAVVQVFVDSEFKDVDNPYDYKRYKAEVDEKK